MIVGDLVTGSHLSDLLGDCPLVRWLETFLQTTIHNQYKFREQFEKEKKVEEDEEDKKDEEKNEDEERNLAGEARGEGDGETLGEADDLGEWGLLSMIIITAAVRVQHHHHHHFHDLSLSGPASSSGWHQRVWSLHRWRARSACSCSAA